eukprot:s3690_g8.t1
MDQYWPLLDDGVLAALKRVYETPLRLEAAFDTEDDGREMLEAEFPDLIGEDLSDAIAALMVWKDSMVRPAKRSRAAIVADNLCRLPQPLSLTVQDEFTKLTKTSSLCVELYVDFASQKKYKDDPADARARRFDAERKKYSYLLSQVIIRAQLPVVQLVNALDDPQSAWLHIFAARRANTLKNRYKVWRPFEQWLEWNRGRVFPKDVKDVIDYMQHRVSNECGRTVPESFSATLGLLEQLGKVPEDERISGGALRGSPTEETC